MSGASLVDEPDEEAFVDDDDEEEDEDVEEDADDVDDADGFVACDVGVDEGFAAHAKTKRSSMRMEIGLLPRLLQGIVMTMDPMTPVKIRIGRPSRTSASERRRT